MTQQQVGEWLNVRRIPKLAKLWPDVHFVRVIDNYLSGCLPMILAISRRHVLGKGSCWEVRWTYTRAYEVWNVLFYESTAAACFDYCDKYRDYCDKYRGQDPLISAMLTAQLAEGLL